MINTPYGNNYPVNPAMPQQQPEQIPKLPEMNTGDDEDDGDGDGEE
jgi:hypothetical protein